MNIPSVILKSTILATCIFWLFTISKGFQIDMLLLVFLSIIPISLCCTFTILLTIAPFFWFQGKEASDRSYNRNKVVFNKYYPFYTIAIFSLCLYGAIKFSFANSFFISVFFTTMQSWVWFAKSNQ